MHDAGRYRVLCVNFAVLARGSDQRRPLGLLCDWKWQGYVVPRNYPELSKEYQARTFPGLSRNGVLSAICRAGSKNADGLLRVRVVAGVCGGDEAIHRGFHERPSKI